MKTESIELPAMQKEKGSICVSVIVPTHRLSPERRADQLEVEKAIKKAKDLLTSKFKNSDIKQLQQSLDDLFESIDFTKNLEGLGIYVSPKINRAVHFPFPVEEKIMVAHKFEMRELLYYSSYEQSYMVLLLSEKGLKLFEGSWDELNEIEDQNFPKEYVEEYDYSTPSRGTSFAGQAQLKSFEKDKGELESIRFKDFFKSADELLTEYLKPDKALILMGVEKELAWFEKITKHSQNIINKIQGSYNYSNPKELSDIVWPVMREHLDQEKELLIKEYSEKIGEEMGVSGIQDIWQSAQEGKAFKLLVEKDYRCPGYVDTDEYLLYLDQPETPHKVLDDAVDELIELVLQKNGQVYFTENNQLKDFGRMLLITRY
ncbi:baeRF3 domain-containing protein [Daejeonella oryzae]|uniref:baeRF3 domain-containing protein n=1 Tax=Daejeonella oryzae TaxID=1122943 RepID=UPI0003F9A6F9|nr:hypothetical protein [Daejeonella oryzae]